MKLWTKRFKKVAILYTPEGIRETIKDYGFHDTISQKIGW